MLSSAKTLMLMENLGKSNNKFQNFLKIRMSIVSLLINKYNPYIIVFHDCRDRYKTCDIIFSILTSYHIFPSYATKDFIQEAHNRLTIC